jgi:hypothetical protein
MATQLSSATYNKNDCTIPEVQSLNGKCIKILKCLHFFYDNQTFLRVYSTEVSWHAIPKLHKQ